MDFEKLQLIEFDIYGLEVRGRFIRMVGEKIIVETTYDYLPDMIGKEQSIHKSHLNKRYS